MISFMNLSRDPSFIGFSRQSAILRMMCRRCFKCTILHNADLNYELQFCSFLLKIIDPKLSLIIIALYYFCALGYSASD